MPAPAPFTDPNAFGVYYITTPKTFNGGASFLANFLKMRTAKTQAIMMQRLKEAAMDRRKYAELVIKWREEQGKRVRAEMEYAQKLREMDIDERKNEVADEANRTRVYDTQVDRDIANAQIAAESVLQDKKLRHDLDVAGNITDVQRESTGDAQTRLFKALKFKGDGNINAADQQMQRYLEAMAEAKLSPQQQTAVVEAQKRELTRLRETDEGISSEDEEWARGLVGETAGLLPAREETTRQVGVPYREPPVLTGGEAGRETTTTETEETAPTRIDWGGGGDSGIGYLRTPPAIPMTPQMERIVESIRPLMGPVERDDRYAGESGHMFDAARRATRGKGQRAFEKEARRVVLGEEVIPEVDVVAEDVQLEELASEPPPTPTPEPEPEPKPEKKEERGVAREKKKEEREKKKEERVEAKPIPYSERDKRFDVFREAGRLKYGEAVWPKSKGEKKEERVEAREKKKEERVEAREKKKSSSEDALAELAAEPVGIESLGPTELQERKTSLEAEMAEWDAEHLDPESGSYRQPTELKAERWYQMDAELGRIRELLDESQNNAVQGD